ncbi:sugar/nucleoside kinase (ribokinase family) [Saccharothrix saharensis]|uniref:Sugar/nucleoside kinase (Ribokinase family) n=1 Tax=Saccharothrix saharensis TaxID=571190 RepID=A0A543J5S8_9PSEU|nr:PfkB family carbohydrate kinase [Saccharothrix saharensis]TQM78138.1 sugar/nucleoside kinase (ribokinase family) [Saccharothrix saharensis]
MRRPKVFVAGPVSWNRLVLLDRLPRARPHTTFAGGHRVTVGGTSAGKALNLASLGADVTLRTVVGDDEAGRSVLDVLDRAGVDVIAEVVDTATEQHLNLMDPHGGRVSIYLELPRLHHAEHDDRALAALASADAAVIDLADHARPLLGAARDAGVPVWCDVHDYDGVAEFHRDFLDAADHVFLNDDAFKDEHSANHDALVAFLRSLGKPAVATLGADGALALVDGTVHRVPAVPIEEIVDTNGAGDAFFSGFLVAHLAGADVPSAMAAGARQAALCLGSAGLAPEM